MGLASHIALADLTHNEVRLFAHALYVPVSLHQQQVQHRARQEQNLCCRLHFLMDRTVMTALAKR